MSDPENKDLINLRRREAAKVLGIDRAWEVFKYNMAYLFCVKCISVSFVWVVVALVMLSHAEWVYVVKAGAAKDLPSMYIWHAVGALFHWANRPLFDRLVEAKAKSIETH